mmetsp:Transcript_10394/g.28631  ORF Transcript_10394/g.28631 Transcript_10394/m.28631 type:complete len:228 (-) Transcript_10394:179-862(-)
MASVGIGSWKMMVQRPRMLQACESSVHRKSAIQNMTAIKHVTLKRTRVGTRAKRITATTSSTRIAVIVHSTTKRRPAERVATSTNSIPTNGKDRKLLLMKSMSPVMVAVVISRIALMTISTIRPVATAAAVKLQARTTAVQLTMRLAMAMAMVMAMRRWGKRRFVLVRRRGTVTGIPTRRRMATTTTMINHRIAQLFATFACWSSRRVTWWRGHRTAHASTPSMRNA